MTQRKGLMLWERFDDVGCGNLKYYVIVLDYQKE